MRLGMDAQPGGMLPGSSLPGQGRLQDCKDGRPEVLPGGADVHPHPSACAALRCDMLAGTS